MRRTALPMVLLLLLVSASYLPMVTAQSGDDNGGIIFGKEQRGEEPIYWEGDLVYIFLVGNFPREPNRVEVERACEGCPEDEVYTRSIDGDTEFVIFPNSFAEARPEHQPRWNGTWQVRVIHTSALGDITMASRTFDVYLVNQFPGEECEDVSAEERPKSCMAAYHPEETLEIHAAGYPLNSNVTAKLIYDPPDEEGEETVVWTETTRETDRDGVVTFEWEIPLSITETMACLSCNDFRVEVQGTGTDKPKESVPITIRPAEIVAELHEYPQAPQRTETAEVAFDLRYNASGDRVNPLTFTDGFSVTDARLKVDIQRVPPTGEPEDVTTLEARYNFGKGLWVANWTIPRDLPLEAGARSYDYRFVLQEGEDEYGNPMPRRNLGNFEVHPYELQPKVWSQPLELERQEQARFVFNFTYADGTVMKEGENATQLEGRLQRVRDTQGDPVAGPSYEIIATYDEDGRWVWKHTFPFDFEDLGTWNFTFTGTPQGTQAEDEHGNKLVSNSVTVFPLVLASPRVELQTTVDGETRGPGDALHRGDTVKLHVTTTYPDGTPITRSDLQYPEHEDGLLVRVHKINEDGIETSVTDHRLELISSYAGLWRGTFDIPKVKAGAPLGTWEIEVVVADNTTNPGPNKNVTRFNRTVEADTLHVTTYTPVPSQVTAGQQESWSFRIRDGQGEPVEEVGTDITVDVVRWENGEPGQPIATELQIYFDADKGSRGAWTVDWRVPRSTDAGTYAFLVKGQDLHGNHVEGDAYSGPFTVVLPEEPRGVLIQPPLTVQRGQEVTVAFHGEPGDYGSDGSDHPRIILERKVSGDDIWNVVSQDLWVLREGPGEDHHAVWNTTTTTPKGTYRFRLEGRGPTHEVIMGTTNNFTVTPRNVTRPVTQAPVPFVEKGTTVTVKIDRKFGDRLGRQHIQLTGPTGQVQTPGEIQIRRTTGNWTVNWTVPYSIQDGAYIMDIRGRDKYDNVLLTRVGPVEVGNVNLLTERLLDPHDPAPRDAPAELVFRVIYPDGSLMTSDHGRPQAELLQDGRRIETLNATFDGVNWHATWVPPAAAEPTSYTLRVDGTDRAGNVIPTLTSQRFDVVPGTLERDILRQPNEREHRVEEIPVVTEAGVNDEFVSFEVLYYGAVHPDSDDRPAARDPRSLGTIPHEWNPGAGRYDAAWEPPQDAPLGWYVIELSGEDAHGNDVSARTQAFQLTPARLSAAVEGRFQELVPGETLRVPVNIVYPNGQPLTPNDGDPVALFMLDARPITPRPDVEYDTQSRRWIVHWDVPLELPTGGYSLQIRGQDDHGNTISTFNTPPIRYEPGAVQQITGATSIPGPGASLALVAVGLALALAGRRRLDGT